MDRLFNVLITLRELLGFLNLAIKQKIIQRISGLLIYIWIKTYISSMRAQTSLSIAINLS